MTDTIQRDINLLTPDMKIVVGGILKLIDYHRLPMAVFETLRTEARQKMLVAQGYSKTLLSNHLTGRACDIVVCRDGVWSWKEKDEFYCRFLGNLVMKNTKGIRWGGGIPDKSFDWDLPHYELRNKTI